MGGGTSGSTASEQRACSRALVLTTQLWPRTQRCSRTAQENLALDNAFVLIDGAPWLCTSVVSAGCYPSAVVSVSIAIAALMMLGLGSFLKWLIIRKWAQLSLNPQFAVFPKICPVCLSSNADSTVDGKSASRQTANYIVARKLEWWKAGVPHCSRCTLKLGRNQGIGFILGAVCVVGALLLMPPPEISFMIVVYILLDIRPTSLQPRFRRESSSGVLVPV